MDQQQPSVWWRVDEAAAHAKVSAKTIYNEVRAGRLKAARVGGRRELRIRPAAVDAWLEASIPVEAK